MKRWIINLLYSRMDDWAKWEVYHDLKCPSLDAVLLEQEKQADKIFGEQPR